MQQVFHQARTPASNGISIEWASWLFATLCKEDGRIVEPDSMFDYEINHTAEVFQTLVDNGWLEVSPVQDPPFVPGKKSKRIYFFSFHPHGQLLREGMSSLVFFDHCPTSHNSACRAKIKVPQLNWGTSGSRT